MKKQINYQAIFFLGLTFIGTGVVFIASVGAGLGTAFIGLGVLYMLIGGSNKDKWPKNKLKKQNKKG